MSMENLNFKKCSKCGLEKIVNLFHKNRATCTPCRSEQARQWRIKNKEQHNKYQSEYKIKRYNSELQFKIKHVLRARLRKAMLNNWKSGSAVSELGCSIEQFKAHIESKFQEGMSWNNWSRDGWHVDHIIPLDNFDLSKIEELKKACHYTNLQPLWYRENSIKSNKVL